MQTLDFTPSDFMFPVKLSRLHLHSAFNPLRSKLLTATPGGLSISEDLKQVWHLKVLTATSHP
jgi:hypothetical protein